jgi:ubiquinone/menaquinone biosynthesis C-methylase UbiE
MSIQDKIIAHYTKPDIADDILSKAHARREGEPRDISVDDLARFDQMHIGGHHATKRFFDEMGFAPDLKVLDIGSGLGGPARLAAHHYNLHVSGIDLTPDYQKTAKRLSRAVGLHRQTDFITGSALDLPFEDKSFDAAYMIHVGMNIEDKATLYKQAARVLRLGGVFGIYDVFAENQAQALPFPMPFPMPWAKTQESSFVVSKESAQSWLVEAGFEILNVYNRREEALEAISKVIDAPETGPKLTNLHQAIEQGVCSPYEIFARR